MENTTIQNLGKLYRLLDEACTPDHANQADLSNATRFPVRGVMMKITLAHKLHKMTPELDNACSYVLKDVDIEDIDSSFALKALSMQQQGVFQIGYMSPDYKTLGVDAGKIKAARESAGLTIRALSEKTGLSTATIQHAEAGKPTRMTTLKKIAAACNVSAEELQG
jgi:DNA-binding XRE family transcriptional regulator|uniref:Helix-turn-helix XRE-family like protein n=1 Tax=Myoviridae sp. ctsNY46 TaxID=2825192 RepID=A0A8S5U7E3_9CAUD|nr:MAG TPA: Helix-turn-helix XRE-family like protein [Myoviridae sp. ctsNY46]